MQAAEQRIHRLDRIREGVGRADGVVRGHDDRPGLGQQGGDRTLGGQAGEGSAGQVQHERRGLYEGTPIQADRNRGGTSNFEPLKCGLDQHGEGSIPIARQHRLGLAIG